jgi:hypothetical protein
MDKNRNIAEIDIAINQIFLFNNFFTGLREIRRNENISRYAPKKKKSPIDGNGSMSNT